MKSLVKLPLIAFCLLLPGQFLLAQETTDYATSAAGGSPVPGIIGLLIGLLIIVAMWKVFTKAGQPGWASIIPIYNLYIWCKIVGRPWWWILLMLFDQSFSLRRRARGALQDRASEFRASLSKSS